ncbi:FmdB family transcriptional regulator [Geminisphaera colitermitum]|uniref:FmdB family transcriptional regulator n=1 Tax=Geminisphaera colitermitum TaxID=1148786 RepID=UPI0005B8CCCA|nr:FmdB family transcriptional regulator [Geminisphaera colitermitum]
MPIYEYYCPDNHTVYQFFAKTLAQGTTTPKCPDNPRFRMEKLVSRFAVTSGAGEGDQAEGAGKAGGDASGVGGDDARMESAMQEMEREFSNVDENDPRAMGRMMRRMAELSGEKIDGEMEEVVRKLEEGQDPEALEEQFGDLGGGGGDDMEDGMGGRADAGEKQEGNAEASRKMRYKVRRGAPRRDPQLYDYE